MSADIFVYMNIMSVGVSICMYLCMYIRALVGWLVGFYGISTFEGFLTPNPCLCK